MYCIGRFSTRCYPHFLIALFLLALWLLPCARASAQNIFISSDRISESPLDQRVDEYTPSGTYVRNLVPYTYGDLYGPYGMAFGPDGNLYVASARDLHTFGFGNRVIRYDGCTGEYLGAILTDSGPSAPTGVCFGPDNCLYVTNTLLNTVVKIDYRTGQILRTYPVGGSNRNSPYNVNFRPDNGNMLVVDYYRNEIMEFDPITGARIGTFASGLRNPIGLEVGPDGRIYVSEAGGNDVLAFNLTNGNISVFTIGGNLDVPLYITFDENGDLWVPSYYNGTVQKFDGATGNYLFSFSYIGPSSITTFRIFPDAARISGTVHLEDCQNSATTLTFEFRAPGHDHTCFTRTVTLQSDGSFSFAPIPFHHYHVRVKGTKWLAGGMDVDATNGDVSGLTATLLAGDANDDNNVDVFDLDLLIQAFNSVEGDENWNDACDFNCDSSVDVFDLDLLVRNFNMQGEL